MKLVIDTDMGIDDALALLLALARPEVNIEAITTVVGNIPLDRATYNAGVVLNIAGAPHIPIYAGCSSPLRQCSALDAVDIHGEDGLGGAGHLADTRPPEPGHAALALIDLVTAQPGELTLLTLGPLTNIALAIRLEPNLLQQVQRLVIMGGSVEAKGNTSAVAEFNVMVDPEAAQIVFQGCQNAGLKAEVLSWETTLRHSLPLERWQQLIAGNSAVSDFARQFTKHIETRTPTLIKTGYLWPDPLAAAVAIVPDIVRRQLAVPIAVDTSFGPGRGQTIVDYQPGTAAPPNATIIQEIDLDQFEQLLQQALL